MRSGVGVGVADAVDVHRLARGQVRGGLVEGQADVVLGVELFLHGQRQGAGDHAFALLVPGLADVAVELLDGATDSFVQGVVGVIGILGRAASRRCGRGCEGRGLLPVGMHFERGEVGDF